MPPPVPIPLQCLYLGLLDSETVSTLRLIPSYATLKFCAQPDDARIPVKFLIGTYGVFEVYACPDGTVHKVVTRDSSLIKMGEVRNVDRALGDAAKLVAPFSWDRNFRNGLITPMTPPVRAIVQLYCQIWAQENGVVEAELETPNFESLEEMFKSIQTAIDFDKKLPEHMQEIQVAMDDEDTNLRFEELNQIRENEEIVAEKMDRMEFLTPPPVRVSEARRLKPATPMKSANPTVFERVLLEATLGNNDTIPAPKKCRRSSSDVEDEDESHKELHESFGRMFTGRLGTVHRPIP